MLLNKMAKIESVETMRYGGYSEKGTDLKLSLFTERGEDNAIITPNGAQLFVNDAPRFANLRKDLGDMVSGRIDGRDVAEIRILRNHPLQYAGMTIENAKGNFYKITEDLRLSGRKSIEGAEIEQIACLDDEGVYMARFCLNDLVSLNQVIMEKGQTLTPGLTLAFSLVPSETQRYPILGGVCTSPIAKINPSIN